MTLTSELLRGFPPVQACPKQVANSDASGVLASDPLAGRKTLVPNPAAAFTQLLPFAGQRQELAVADLRFFFPKRNLDFFGGGGEIIYFLQC